MCYTELKKRALSSLPVSHVNIKFYSGCSFNKGG